MGPEPVVGSVTPDQGSFYLLQAGSDPITEISPVSISNGLAWSEDNTQLYYIDTATGQVDVFDFDLERAKIGECYWFRQTGSIFRLKLFCVKHL
jgi:sugar lactone lactonase YvrE